MRISKTVGHAFGKVGFQKHPELLRDAQHNKRVDSQADRARTHYLPAHIRTMATTLSSRHSNYVALLAGIHTILRRMFLAIDKLRNSQAY